MTGLEIALLVAIVAIVAALGVAVAVVGSRINHLATENDPPTRSAEDWWRDAERLADREGVERLPVRRIIKEN